MRLIQVTLVSCLRAGARIVLVFHFSLAEAVFLLSFFYHSARVKYLNHKSAQVLSLLSSGGVDILTWPDFSILQ